MKKPKFKAGQIWRDGDLYILLIRVCFRQGEPDREGWIYLNEEHLNIPGSVQRQKFENYGIDHWDYVGEIGVLAEKLKEKLR